MQKLETFRIQKLEKIPKLSKIYRNFVRRYLPKLTEIYRNFGKQILSFGTNPNCSPPCFCIIRDNSLLALKLYVQHLGEA